MGQLLNITDDLKGVDPRMVDIVKRAAAASPYDVKITDAMRAGGKGNHKHGYAIDVALIDPKTGAELPNKMYYSNGDVARGVATRAQVGSIIPGAVDAFPVYERFAQTARVYQTQQYPELNNTFRWGGGFRQGGTPFDMMHLDITPKAGGAMAYYDWNTGLTPAALARIPELKGSEGLGGANGRRLVGALGQSLQGGPVPPGSIPDVASLTDTQRAPVAPMPLPSFMRPAVSSTASLSKTLGARLPEAAMYGVRPGGKRATADDLTMTPGMKYAGGPPGVIADDRLMSSLMRSQDAVRADPIGAGPASWFPKAAQPAATSTAQIKTDPLGAGAGSWGDFTRALGVPLAAPAPLTSGAGPTPLPSGVMRAVTPGVQQAGTVAMPPGARPASVPPLPRAAGVDPIGAGPGSYGNLMGLIGDPVYGGAQAPTPFPGRPAALSTPAPAPMPQRPALPAPSAQVRDLQSALTARGFNPGSADGIFGPRTDAAVRAFQQANGLAVDGIVGPKTMAALQGTRTAPQPLPAPLTPSAKPAPMPKGYSDNSARASMAWAF